MTQKILILYENVGSGHKRVADILETILSEVEDVQVVSYAASELFNDSTIQLVNRLWTMFLRRNWIRLTDGFINFFLRIWVAPIVEALETGNYLDKLEGIDPDILICTYDAFGKVLGTYAQEKDIPYFLVITDHSIFSDLVNPHATHLCYFPETINAVRSFDMQTTYFAQQIDRDSSTWDKLKYVIQMYRDHALFRSRHTIFRNIDRVHREQNMAKAIAVGPIVEPAYYGKQNQREMRDKHNIDIDTSCLLVVSGSIGGSFISDMVHTFQQQVTEPLTILAVCGRDQKSFETVCGMQERKSQVKVIPLGFVDYLHELYVAADAVVARPSAGVLLESLMCRTPLITTELATANDLGGIELIKGHQLGEVYRRSEEVPGLFRRMMTQRQRYIDNIDRLLASYPASFADFAGQMREIILPASRRVAGWCQML
ncbi:MAG: glycosyltransferase [Chloroflexota bacterium]